MSPPLLLLLGANMSTWALFHDELEETIGVGMFDWCYWSKCWPNGGVLWHLEMRALSCCIGIAIKTASKVGTFCIVVLLIVTLATAGAIRSELLPNGGVQWLPVMPWSCCIRWCAWYCVLLQCIRCICLSPPPFLLGVIVAKEHFMVH